MGIHIAVVPDGVKVDEIKDDDGVVQVRALSFIDARSGIEVKAGPFASDEWDQLLVYLANPDEEAAKQEARQKILMAGGELPKMSMVKGG